MRSPVVVLLAVCAAAVLALALTGLTTREHRAFTLGVASAGPVVTLQPGQQVCQEPIAVPDDDAAFDRVAFVLGTRSLPVDVTVAEPSGRVVGRGRRQDGHAGGAQSVAVGPVTTRESLRVCLRDAGNGRLVVFGNGDAASRTTTAAVDGKPVHTDISLVFERAEPRSALSLVPAFFERMSLWRASWVGAWTYWLLGAIVLAAVPVLLAFALRSVLREF
jgi:hypothetical protein